MPRRIPLKRIQNDHLYLKTLQIYIFILFTAIFILSCNKTINNLIEFFEKSPKQKLTVKNSIEMKVKRIGYIDLLYGLFVFFLAITMRSNTSATTEKEL